MNDKKKTFKESMEEQRQARMLRDRARILKEQAQAKDLGERGEKLLQPNLRKDEKVLTKLRGRFGQGLVVTDRHVFVLKWGYMAGNTFGGRCIGYAYPNITALELKKHATYGLVQILTPATQDNRKLSYWDTSNNNNDADKSDNAVVFGSGKTNNELFQEAVMLARDVMANMNGSAPVGVANDDIGQLERLAELRNKGIITEQEFAAKKKQVLGL